MKTEELIADAQRMVKELRGRINGGGMGLDEAEGQILEMVNWIGDTMVQEVVAGLAEPTSANQITIGGEVAVFERVRNLRFINRFGEEVVRPRRCYRYRDRAGGVAPLDAKLGIDGCFGFSPLMTYLICMLGADESYGGAADKLAATLGFKVSSTAVQRTTEKTGERIPDDPEEVIGEQRQQEPCSLMVVEVDGTTSPQIKELEGITGRASLRAGTCYKECNLVVIEKRSGEKVVDRWTGARYGPRREFVEYAEQAGLRMGYLQAPESVFLADGARHNWDMQETHFPGSVPILDYYHATEHLADYCDLLPAALRAGRHRRWRTLMWNGEVLQMIVELKQSLAQVTDTDAAWKQINYFTNNQHRMDYRRYRDAGWPIGSGLVEGQCKFLVARRFKGNGMRWRPHDNRCVLSTRLALLNGDLKRYFSPSADCEIAAA